MYFFVNDTATTEIYTLSLHDALPIFLAGGSVVAALATIAAVVGRRTVPRAETSRPPGAPARARSVGPRDPRRSEEHTSELQSRQHLLCRLLLVKKIQ